MGPEITGLVLLGLALGLRHGIDWDHIVAIADIAGSANRPDERLLIAAGDYGASHTATTGETALAFQPRRAARASFSLTTLYVLGHATVVVFLGLLAIWAATVLPEWIDPLMERVVGITLLLLGAWILYSLTRYGRSFRLRSRWMLVLDLVAHAWAGLKARATGQRIEHVHTLRQYGSRTAFGIGMIHGIGAETGSQALLLAAAAGATSAAQGTLMLLSFTVGLLISNTAVAALSVLGFVSSTTKHSLYAMIAVVAAVSSLIVGSYFVTGNGDALPDLQQILAGIFGAGAEL